MGKSTERNPEMNLSVSPVHHCVTVTGHVFGTGLARWDVPFARVEFLVAIVG